MFTVYPFMVTELNLTGAELLVYSYLYTTTTIDRDSIEKWYSKCGAGSLSTVRRAVSNLIKKGYLRKTQDSVTSPAVYECMEVRDETY